MVDKKAPPEPRQFPTLFEKGVPIAIGMLIFVILIMLLFALAVVAGVF